MSFVGILAVTPWFVNSLNINNQALPLSPNDHHDAVVASSVLTLAFVLGTCIEIFTNYLHLVFTIALEISIVTNLIYS